MEIMESLCILQAYEIIEDTGVTGIVKLDKTLGSEYVHLLKEGHVCKNTNYIYTIESP